MKKLFMITATHALAIPGFAQTGSEALLGASDGIYSYVPFIQGLCYVIAALIAIVGAASVYMAMQTSPQQVSKRIVTSVGSCLFLSAWLSPYLSSLAMSHILWATAPTSL